MGKKKKKINKKVVILEGVKIGMVVLLFGINYVMLKYLLPIWFPFLVALMIATLLQPIVNWFEARKIPRAVGTVIGFFLFALLNVVVFALVGKMLFAQVMRLIKMYPQIANELSYNGCLLCNRIDQQLCLKQGCSMNFCTHFISNMQRQAMGTFPNLLTNQSAKYVMFLASFLVIFITILFASFYLTRDYEMYEKKMKGNQIMEKGFLVFRKFYDMIFVYMKAQFVIFLIDALALAILFLFVNRDYFFLMAVTTSLVDFLPVLGSGFVLFPWAMYLLITGHYLRAFLLFIAYVICVLIRNFVEPLFVGKTMRISTLTAFVTMYAGFRLFGILGFAFGPMSYMLGKQCYLFLKPILLGDLEKRL